MDETSRKTALIQFLQKHIGRTLTRSDVTYATTGSDGAFESCVTLHCLDEESFKGAPGSSEKEAERNAAHMALTKHAADVGTAPLKVKPAKASRRSGRGSSSKALVLDGVPKTDLIRFLQRFVGRTLTAADTMYSVAQVGGQYQATLVIACLDAEGYMGGLCANARLAEHSAAQRALETHSADVHALSRPVGAPAILAAHGRLRHGHVSVGVDAKERKVVTGAAPLSHLHQQKRPSAPSVAKGLAAGSHKTKLIQFLQFYVGRTLTKDDIVYQVADQGDTRTASVVLQCLEGRQFVGGPEQDDKMAQQNVAAVALQDFHSEVAAWEAMPRRRGKRRTPTEIETMSTELSRIPKVERRS